MEIMRKYMLNNDFPVHKPQAIYLKIKRRQKIPACSLSKKSDMFRQQITWKKTNRAEADVTSSHLYNPLFETYFDR